MDNSAMKLTIIWVWIFVLLGEYAVQPTTCSFCPTGIL